MINLELYKIFKIVAEEENITKASERLSISQPAVTKHIHNLEALLNEKLFDRYNKGLRLTEIGHEVGLISEERYQKFLVKKSAIEKEVERLENTVIKPTEKVNQFLAKYQSSPLTTGAKLAELLRRTELKYEDLKEIDEQREELPKEVAEEVEIEVKYKGYIKLQQQQVEKFKKLERKLLPQEIDYSEIKGLRLEARQKLNKIKPNSVGQASRISGVSPADISVLLIYLEQQKA